MTAKEFLEHYKYTEGDQGQWYTLTIKEICDLMEGYATDQLRINSSTKKNKLVIPDVSESALSDAFDCCRIIELTLGNVISDPDSNTPDSHDVENYNKAKRFIDYYKRHFC